MSRLVVSAALLALVCTTLPVRAQGGEDRLEDAVEDPAATEAPEPAPPGPVTGPPADPSDTPAAVPPAVPARAPLPPLPSADELRALANADPAFARATLRRAARSAPDARRRALGVLVLSRIDPRRATARVCSRSLRIDPSPKVRRAAAECLGRLPPEVAGPESPALLAALGPAEALDVRAMAGWAAANVGDPSAIEPVTALAAHEDPRVAKLFYEYAMRLRSRHGLPLRESEGPDLGGGRLVPPGDALIAQSSGLQTAASTAWLALYGGMSGWLHGGFFPAAHGGAAFQQISALTALGGAVTGIAVGGAYGFFGADRLQLSHTVVQLGTASTLTGYGLGLLSSTGPQAGINMASFGLSGAIIGTTIGVVVAETLEPTPGALALGAAAGIGSAYSFGALAAGYSLLGESLVGISMVTGGAAAILTTIVAAPYDVGLLPIAGATVGGLAGGTLGGLLLVVVEGAQLAGQPEPFTAGSGWAVAGGYVVGASLGAAATYFIPAGLDPFRIGGVRLSPPQLGAVADLRTPGRAIPVAQLGGVF